MKVKQLYLKAFIIIALVICIGTSLGILYFSNNSQDKGVFTPLEVSNNQMDAKKPNLNKNDKDEYFELVGYGQLEINKSNPYINLINPSENSVYLSFDVIYNDESLYSTKLIEPGKMEQYDIYSCLDAGEHTLDYVINVYDLVDKKPLWAGINQEQQLIVKK